MELMLSFKICEIYCIFIIITAANLLLLGWMLDMVKISMEVVWDYFGWGFVVGLFYYLRNATNNLSDLNPVVRKLEVNE